MYTQRLKGIFWANYFLDHIVYEFHHSSDPLLHWNICLYGIQQTYQTVHHHTSVSFTSNCPKSSKNITWFFLDAVLHFSNFFHSYPFHCFAIFEAKAPGRRAAASGRGRGTISNGVFCGRWKLEIQKKEHQQHKQNCWFKCWFLELKCWFCWFTVFFWQKGVASPSFDNAKMVPWKLFFVFFSDTKQNVVDQATELAVAAILILTNQV